MGTVVDQEHRRHLYGWSEGRGNKSKWSPPIEEAHKLFMITMFPAPYKDAVYVNHIKPHTYRYRDAMQSIYNLEFVRPTPTLVDTASTDTELVLEALSNPEFEWRTIPGISQETELDNKVIEKVLSESRDQIVRSSRITKDGRERFTTRSRFQEFTSPWTRLLGALKNRAD